MRCCQSLTDDSGRLGILVIIISERSSALKSRPARMGTPSDAKNPGGDDTPLRRGSLPGGMDVSVAENCRPEAAGTAPSAPGNDIAVGGLAHARQGIDTEYRFPWRNRRPAGCPPIGHSRNVDRETCCVSNPVCVLCQCHNVVINILRAGQNTKDAAICVRDPLRLFRVRDTSLKHLCALEVWTGCPE